MKKISFKKIMSYTLLAGASFFGIFPFIWMIIGATNKSVNILTGKMSFGSELFNNLKVLFNEYNMSVILGNSIKITGITVILTLIICSMSAYGFLIYKSKNRERIYNLILLAMMVPLASLMIPLFQIIAKLNLIDTHFGLIIVSIVPIFILFFFRQSFVSYPYDVIQAARVDGASEMNVFLKIFVPSVKSTYAAAAIYAFTTSWNAYLMPLIILRSPEKTTTTQLIARMSSAYQPDYGVIMLTIIIATLPTIVVFFAFQKQFVQGMLGSVKS